MIDRYTTGLTELSLDTTDNKTRIYKNNPSFVHMAKQINSFFERIHPVARPKTQISH